MTTTTYEKRKQDLLEMRARLVPEKIRVATLVSHKRLYEGERMLSMAEYEERRRPWVERLAAIEAHLVAIKTELREIAEAETVGRVDIPSTKRAMIGRLMAWRDEAANDVKNPRSTPAGKHYAQVIVQRITAIIEAES